MDLLIYRAMESSDKRETCKYLCNMMLKYVRMDQQEAFDKLMGSCC